MTIRTFASDNYSGVHPEIMKALAECNANHAPAYGADPYTAAATAHFKNLFGMDTEVFFVYNGTGANVLGLSALTRSFEAIVCSERAHINVDESTAPEKFTGNKLITVPSVNGKITGEAIDRAIIRKGDQHHAQARVISISQLTEYATSYSLDELVELRKVATNHNCYLHMDGSRIANAAVGRNMELRAMTRDAGIDVLSFGGTKNGLMFGEAILFFKPELAENFKYLRKQGMQLHSKMRFIGAQYERLLRDNLWATTARHANAMATMLATGLKKLGVTITQEVNGNGVFALLAPEVISRVQQDYYFYVWNETISEVRLMCSFETTESDVTGFLESLSKAL